MAKYWCSWLVGMRGGSSRAICSIMFGGVCDRFHKLRDSSPRSQFVPNRPEIVKDGFAERLFQEWNAGRSACSLFRADRALNQFDVTITPFLQSFIEIGH